MNYEERQQEICKMCIEGTKCSYKSRNLEYKCPNLSDNMYGWELGWQDAIDKACEWMEKFVRNSVVTDGIDERTKQAIVTSFKEYMEEQQ